MNSIFTSELFKKSRIGLPTILVIAILLVSPLTVILPVLAPPTTVLTPKWTRTGLGSNYEGGLVIGDVTGDGQEDVVFGGNDLLSVLNGQTGATIATYSQSRIGQYCQPQLYDVDGDGVLDILVPLFYLPGLAAVRYDGDSTLSLLWSVNTEGPSGSGSVMAKPVAADIDNDGHLDIFIASQDVSPADNSSGTPIPNGYDGTICRINYQGQIVASTFTWRPCSGGLSLADTDNDGVFELYQGDRQTLNNAGGRGGYSDGGYGKGLRSLWADNLTIRWTRLDFLSSSQSPVLVDVNGDGTKDVLAGMYREMNILNSTNGQMIKRVANNTMSVHYGFTVYDIDGDGHLELLNSDGDHDDDPYADVFDLVTGKRDAQLSLAGGDWKWGPVVADIDPTHSGMEIIVCPNGTTLGTQYYHGAIMIYANNISSNNYASLQNVTYRPGSPEGQYSTTRLNSQLGYPIVQDIDSDDLLELVVCTSGGHVYAYNTQAPAPGYSSLLPGTQRIRSEVTYFGEARLGVAEHTIMPWEENYWTAPLVAPVSPGDNALAVPVSTDHLSFKLREHQSNPITYTVNTSPYIGSGSGSNTSNSYAWSTYTLNFIQPLAYDTTYTWMVSATDGVNSTVRTYSFRTELAPKIGNHVPTQDTPSLVSQDGLNTTSSTFNCSSQGTADLDGDEVTNIYRWQVNGNPVANLLLPFDTRNETMTKDYSVYGNNGVVKGATWTENGKVGGAYSFDGKDDAIIISDGGAGYYDNKTHSDYNPELGGNGRWNEITVEAWIYPTAYTNGSRIIAKLPSYELGFASGYTNRLIASVTPYLGKIAPVTTDNGNQATTDSLQTVTYTFSSIQLNTWYHIAFTYENGVGLKLYLNGALVAQSSRIIQGTIESSLGEPLYIGRLVQPFKGSIDEVRIYSYAQPPQQILSRYLESKDGLSSSSLFYPLGLGVPGNTLRCQVIPTDSFEEGSTANSASITLLNSVPNASNLQIYPIRARNLRLDNENLAASYAYFDIDGNAESGTQIRWYQNGVLQSGFNDLKQVPAASTSVGDKWNFTVKPKDSLGGFGSLQASYTVTIIQNTPPSTNTPQLVSSQGGNFDDEDLIASAQGTSDANGDNVTNIYHWSLEGTSLTNLQMPFDTETPRYLSSNATAKDYSGYGNDGTVVNATWVQTGIVGGALSFTGNSYVRVNEKSSSLGGDGSWSAITVEFWIKATGTTGTEREVIMHNANYSTSSSSPYGIGYRVDFRARNTGNQVWWYVYRSNGVNSTSFTMPASGWLDWHHVVCTYKSGAGMKIYVDGQQKASIVPLLSGNINAALDGLLDIGGFGASATDLSRILDEVRIYPRALSAAQVFQRYIETKDGLSASSTIVAQETAAGDDWTCQVIPNDSWENGTAKNSANLHVNAVVGNSRPRIDWYSPASLTPAVNEGASLAFAQVSSDPDGNPLSYKWELDSVQQVTTQNWTYSPDLSSAGLHTVKVTVSDGSLTDSQTWQVTVNNYVVQYDLTVQAGVGGTTDPAPNTYTYNEGEGVPVTAIADASMELSHWLLDGVNVGNSNPYTVTMNTNHDIEARFVASSQPPHVPLSGWQMDPLYTNAPYVLSSSVSSLYLELDATNTNSRVTISNLNIPKLSLSDYTYMNVTVSGTGNAKILLRFFLDDGTGFDVVWWQSPATLNVLNFDLSPYADRMLDQVYVALMSSDGTQANITVTQIAFLYQAVQPLIPLSGWEEDPVYTNAPYVLSSSVSSLYLELDAVDTSSRVTIFHPNTPKLSLSDYAYINVTVSGTGNAKILLRFFLDDGTGFDVVWWGSPATLNAIRFDLSPYAGRTLNQVYIALMSANGTLANINVTQIAFAAQTPLSPFIPLSGWTMDPFYTNAPYVLNSNPSSLYLQLDAIDISSRVTIYNFDIPKLSFSDYAYINATVSGTGNAKILLRFFLDDGTGFDVVWWGSPATLNAIEFDLTPYAGRTLNQVYVALMSSDGTQANITITQIEFVHA